MSAITGIYNTNNEPVAIEQGLGLMRALRKYPAHDIHVWHESNIFLGCHAQWITPESINEQLPYFDRERRLAITADAIIDNREELFERLQIKHGDRKGMPDSQLILLSYQKWEEDCPKFLVGDFAFMIWDERKQRLFGARDFSGSRTLYYYHNKNCFAFCTVIHPLFSLPYIQKQLNEQWLAEFLAIVGMVDVVDASITVYKDIMQIPPSHSITVTDERVKLTRYCTLTSNNQLKLKSDRDYVDAFREVFSEAVRCRLRTHHLVGAQLSGGLDSGSIVSFAAKELYKENKPLHTFSYIPPRDFEDFTPKYIMANETPFIRLTTEHIGGINDHYLDFEGRDSYTEVEDFLDVMQMPYKFFENSFWLKGMFEKAQEEHVGVLLNGGRGNLSISWGSAVDYYALLLKKLKWIRLGRELNNYSKNVGGNRYRKLPVIARGAFPYINKLFSSGGSSYEFPVLINPELAKRTGVFNKLHEYGFDETGWFSSSNIYEQRRRHFEDVFHWNASNTVASKLSLKYAVWKRDPTNDLRVIRFCLSLPEEQYVQNGLDRALIRRATENYLPDKVRLNQRIHGVQGADWVYRMMPYWNQFTQELQQVSSNKKILELVNSQVLNKALAKAKKDIRPEYATDPDFKILMRSLIVYRFVRNFA